MNEAGGPLTGCVVVLTADRRKHEFASTLTRYGADVRHAPALTTVANIDGEQLIADTHALIAHPPEMVIITTAIGLRGWIEAAEAAGVGEELIATLRRVRLLARGAKARGALHTLGLEAAWVAETGTSAELIAHVKAQGAAGRTVAVQNHGARSDVLCAALADAGAIVDSLHVYQWGPPADPESHHHWVERAAAGEVDAVVFTSEPGAHSWLSTAQERNQLVEIQAKNRAAELLVAAIGPVTAAPLRAAGLDVCHPDRWRLGALARLLVQHYSGAGVGIETVDGTLVMRATTAVLHGRVLPLTPTGLHILRALAKAHGEVLSREQLASLLPGTNPGPHAVEAAINRLRENADAPALVRTVVRRGYALAVAA